MNKKVFLVGGARPNFMKLAPIYREFKKRDKAHLIDLVHSGQHYDKGLSDVFFDELELPPPSHTLNVGSGTHGAQTAKVLDRFEKILIDESSPIAGVIVVGDVNSTLAAALAAKKLKFNVAHVEAGLRSFDRTMPEEINRLATDAISDLLLVSEPDGLINLRKEGVSEERIAYTGNVMIDSLVYALSDLDVEKQCRDLDISIADKFILVTIHRPSNVDNDEQLKKIVSALIKLSTKRRIIFPVHPRTRAKLLAANYEKLLLATPNIRLLEPVSYKTMLALIKSSDCVLTDSGGIQEETTHLKTDCYTLRPNTERPVTVKQGSNILLGDDVDNALRIVQKALDAGTRDITFSPIDGWDGSAAVRVVDVLSDSWSI